MKTIHTIDDMEDAAIRNGVLPFFPCAVPGLSVAEMTPPGLLFGGDTGSEGCWEWKGPVIRRKTTAYGKFFSRKAGFVALDLLPDFLNWRRSLYPVRPASTEEMLLDILSVNEGLTSTELRRLILGTPSRRRGPNDLVDITRSGAAPQPETPTRTSSRHSLEGHLQRLQMGGHLLISDFTYKLTRTGQRYGWGVARYATPESHLDIGPATCPPRESHDRLLAALISLHPTAPLPRLAALLR